MKSKSGQRHNALKLGAFAKELLILDENKNDFNELHNSCIKELKPAGLMEEEVVLAIAKYMWRKHRIDRLFVEEAKWLREHPIVEDLKRMSLVNESVQNGYSCNFILKNTIAFLPELLRNEIEKDFPRPATDLDDEWISKIKKLINHRSSQAMELLFDECMDSRFIGETAAKIRELTAKQTALEDRLDMMIDKALKRLANLKAFKEVMAIQEAAQPRKISAGITGPANSA